MASSINRASTIPSSGNVVATIITGSDLTASILSTGTRTYASESGKRLATSAWWSQSNSLASAVAKSPSILPDTTGNGLLPVLSERDPIHVFYESTAMFGA